MSLQFKKIKTAVAQQFKRMESHQLFRVSIGRDEIWEQYLASFPSGSNPMFRERTEHDCSCCRQFVRAIGSLVAVIDGEMVSVWNTSVDDPAYQAVVDAMANLVESKPIDNVFLTVERKVGMDKSFEDAVDGVRTWEHFFVNVPADYVVRSAAIGPKLSEARSRHGVLLRSLNEITPDSVATVLDLIAQNSLYRGEEHRVAVLQFKGLQQLFEAAGDPSTFAWSHSVSVLGSVAKIRNTSIGTLLVDLSNGRSLEESVGAFERMVAPANYKRPTALVTKAMVAKAKAKLSGLGLTSALERRYATLEDVDVTDILFADRSAKSVMGGDVFDEIAASVPDKKNLDRVDEVPVSKFLADIVPNADSVEVLFENRHAGNLVSLIAPGDPTAGRIFKWANLFSWSYSGDFADSIKERVKRAGGNVTGDLCCRLAWFNHDDLDLHMVEPGGNEIQFSNMGPSPNKGQLDVDMNVSRLVRDPVENIYYPSAGAMSPGIYRLFVRNYQQRETRDVGFEVEIDIMGKVHRFGYDEPVKQDVQVARVGLSKSGEMKILDSLPSATTSREVWGVDSETFQRVNVIMHSPNHWSGRGVGNRHYFFMVDGCTNDGSARGFYNEFLSGDLDEHRKVFEVVGSKMRADGEADQLSGLGFSSTQRNNLLIRVGGSFTRTVRVMF